MEELIKRIRRNEKIEQIDLCYENYTDNQMKILLAALKKNNHVKTFNYIGVRP